MNERDNIEKEAADWLARIDRGLDDQGVASFEQWKAASIDFRRCGAEPIGLPRCADPGRRSRGRKSG